MANVRKAKRSRFTSLSNGLLQDSNLSFSCRGMMAYLLSKPTDWETRPEDIEREGGIGKDARRAIMKEAEMAGYLTFHTSRKPNGQFENWYDAHEEPVPENERTASWETGKARSKPGAENPQPVEAEPGTGFPLPVEPGAGEPPAGQPVPVIKKEVQSTDLQKTERENALSPASSVSAIWQEVFGEPITIHAQEILESAVSDLDAFRRTLEIWKMNGYSRRSLDKILDRYNQEAKNQTKQSVSANHLRLVDQMPDGLDDFGKTRWLKEQLAKGAAA